MHPELLNNSLFLKYYQQWQEDPTSIAFVPIADYFLTYGMAEEALRVCLAGIKKHPMLVSGRIMMAKINLKRKHLEEAEEEIAKALKIMPTNKVALSIMDEIKSKKEEELPLIVPQKIEPEIEDKPVPQTVSRSIRPPDSWNTVTMAQIYAAQGHLEQARDIYESILASDPENHAAKQGLQGIG